MRNWKRLVIAAIAVVGISVPLPAYAQDVETRACPEVGRHQYSTNVTKVFMPGSLPKSWLDPGVTYTVTRAKTSNVTASVTGGLSAEVVGFAQINISANIAESVTVSETQGWSWTNTTNTTQWVQLGSRGYEFEYTRYDVVAPCDIVNRVSAHAKLPTNEPWLVHS